MNDKQMDIYVTLAGALHDEKLITLETIEHEPSFRSMWDHTYIDVYKPAVVQIGLRLDVALAVKHKVDKYIAELREKELQDLLDARQIWLNRKVRHMNALKLRQEEVANAEEKELNLQDQYNKVKALSDEEFLDYIENMKGDKDGNTI